MMCRVFALGDSVMEGAGPNLYRTLERALPGIEVDAVPNRQFRHAVDIVRERPETDVPQDRLVVHLGTNGIFSDATFDDLMGAASGFAEIVVLTIKAPRDWESSVNERIARGVKCHRSRVELLDWWSIASQDPTLLCRDGFHLTAAGAVVYAEAVAEAVRRPDAGSTGPHAPVLQGPPAARG